MTQRNQGEALCTLVFDFIIFRIAIFVPSIVITVNIAETCELGFSSSFPLFFLS